MTLTIPDDMLQRMGVSEQQARVEIACRMYDAQLITKPDATKLAGLARPQFEDELLKRGLPLIRLDEQYVRQETKAVDRWEQEQQRAGRGE